MWQERHVGLTGNRWMACQTFARWQSEFARFTTFVHLFSSQYDSFFSCLTAPSSNQTTRANDSLTSFFCPCTYLCFFFLRFRLIYIFAEANEAHLTKSISHCRHYHNMPATLRRPLISQASTIPCFRIVFIFAASKSARPNKSTGYRDRRHNPPTTLRCPLIHQPFRLASLLSNSVIDSLLIVEVDGFLSVPNVVNTAHFTQCSLTQGTRHLGSSLSRRDIV
jgi:hypothetical protein